MKEKLVKCDPTSLYNSQTTTRTIQTKKTKISHPYVKNNDQSHRGCFFRLRDESL